MLATLRLYNFRMLTFGTCIGNCRDMLWGYPGLASGDGNCRDLHREWSGHRMDPIGVWLTMEWHARWNDRVSRGTENWHENVEETTFPKPGQYEETSMYPLTPKDSWKQHWDHSSVDTTNYIKLIFVVISVFVVIVITMSLSSSSSSSTTSSSASSLSYIVVVIVIVIIIIATSAWNRKRRNNMQ